ncbi:MAG: ATP-binding cassette domain-containing protein [Nitrospinae bacterium]|nr:ATP-binding cassette domain-containing protein [Nitrospinota bacterium]
MIRIDIRKKLMTAEGKRELSVSLEIEKGEFTTLFGKSGAGKTTLLRIIAGLTEPDEGILTVNGETWIDTAKDISLPAKKRKTGFVFQDYALFPNMSVKENLEFACEKQDDRRKVDELMEMMSLAELKDRKPGQLSGGQQQRVALARALIRNPEVLLLDEPLSALDHETRQKLQNEIINLHKYFSPTVIMVSHDIGEVYKLSKKVFCLEEGLITKSGTPSEVFNNKKMRGRFQLMGEVLEIVPSDIVFEVSLLIGNHFTRVLATEDEVKDLQAGDRVFLLSKAFNPILIKTN